MMMIRFKIASSIPSRYQRLRVQTLREESRGVRLSPCPSPTRGRSVCASCCVFISLPSALAAFMAAWLDAAQGSICAQHQATLPNCSAAPAPASVCTQGAPLGAMLCTQVSLPQQLPRGGGGSGGSFLLWVEVLCSRTLFSYLTFHSLCAGDAGG